LTITVYVDVLFFINLIIDYIIISSTAFILNKSNNTFRFITASATGALYSTVIFFPQLKILNVIFLKILISFIIVFIAFKYQSIVSHIKIFITYYLINFIYGGGMYAFYRFTNLGSKMNYSNGEYYIDLSLGAIILLSVLFYFLIKIFGRFLSDKPQQAVLKQIEITINGNKVCTNALIDTGNNLYEPISQKPVILVEKDVINKILDVNFKLEYKYIKKYKMRIIPFYDASGESNIIYALKPDRVYNISDDILIENVLIGISEHRLSPDHTYQALMHAKHFSRSI